MRSPAASGQRNDLQTARSTATLVLLALIALAGCWRNALAPTDASVLFRVTSVPVDPGISVTAFVKGSEVLFDNLGAGFEIQVGVANPAPYGCRLLSMDGTYFSPNVGDVIATQPGSVDTVTANLACRSGTIDLVVSGLPAGESALVDLVSPSEPQTFGYNTKLAGNGSTLAAVFPDPRVSVEPQRLISGGRVYQASLQVVAVTSRATATVAIQYAPQVTPPAPTATVDVQLTGAPVDPGLGLTAFVRGTTAATPNESAPVVIGGSVVFANLPPGSPIDVGLENLATNRCTVVSASHPFTATTDWARVQLTTRSAVTDVVSFDVRCSSARLDVVVAGLPANDLAQIDVVSPFESRTLRVPNGTSTLTIVPHSAVQITPAPVIGSDTRTYQAAPASVQVPSRQTTTATVRYTAPSAPAACNVNAPIAWYPLNGNAQDSTGNGNHGTIVGALPMSDRTGAAGKALNFDGIDDHIDLGDRFNALALPFSISMWLYKPPVAGGEYRSLFATDNEPGRFAGVYFQFEPGNLLSINYGDATGAVDASHRSLVSNAAPQVGAWMHVAATVRGPADMSLYVNGAPIPGTYAGSGGALAHTSATARIGSHSFVAQNRPWFGILDEVRIYDCSLSAADVSSLGLRP